MSGRDRRALLGMGIAALAAALGASCSAPARSPRSPWDAAAGAGCLVETPASPLLLGQSQALDQELGPAAKRGVVIVAYDCRGLRVLGDCRANGIYDDIGVTLRRQDITLATPIELQLSAPGHPGEAPPPAPISLTLLVGGVATASRHSVARADLEGRCEGATHFVRAFDLGAVIAKGAKVPDCFADEKQGGDDARGRCSQGVRMYLEPFGPEGPRGALRDACPGGAVLSAGKCALASGAGPHRCRGDDAAGCAEQCRLGDVGSCAEHGRMRMEGRGAPADLPAALGILRRACEAGDRDACRNAALAASRIEPAPAGVDTIDLISLGCARGDAEACFELGSALHQRPEADARKAAANVFSRACRGGHREACGVLAEMFREGLGVPEDAGAARRLFERACTAGLLRSCVNLGVMYRAGKGGAVDFAGARRLFERACAAGTAGGCGNLGVLFLSGEGVEPDFVKAAALLEKGCAGSVGAACGLRGRMRERALGAPRDLAGAARDYARGCELGDPTSCTELGRLTRTGEGVPRDDRAAAALFRKACDAGDEVACHNLAMLHAAGEGVEKSPARAREMFQKACKAGFEPSCKAAGQVP